MKPRFVIPALTATLAAGGALLTLHAQDNPPPKTERKFEFKFNGDPRFGGPMKDQLRKMMEQMKLEGDAKQQFEKALENWEAGADDGEARPGQPKQFRFEFRNDGSGPKFFRDGKEVKPANDAGDNADPLGQMRKEMEKEMEDLLRKHMGDGAGPGASPFDDFFKQMRERQRPGQQQKDPSDGGAQNLQEMLRRMQGRSHGEPDAASRYCKEHRSVLAEWRPLVKSAREATVRLLKDNRQIAMATVVSADGYALTKSSEVSKGVLEAEFHDGRIVGAKVVDKLESYDLALIKLDASGLKPATFSASDAPVGTLVAAVGVDEDPLATGVISIAARSLSDKGKGALGIMFDIKSEEAEKGVAISKVFPNCPAEKAGLRSGDVIIAVNGTATDFRAQLLKEVASLRPGDKVKVRYSRDGKEAELEFPLMSREELNKISLEEEAKEKGVSPPSGGAPLDRRLFDPTARMGGSLSANAGGYPNAVQSDLVIESTDCGGPVVDVDGNVVALSIARSERVSTYMIPGKVIQELLANVQSGKFTLAKDADTLRGEVREYEDAIRKAQEAMKAAEASKAAAEAELQKIRK